MISPSFHLRESIERSAARGHQVTMFTTHPEEGKWDGVLYVNAGQSTRECPFGEKFHYYAANTPHDVLLCQRQPRVFHYQWASRINILQTHDLALFRYAGEVGDALWNLSAVTCVSAWHADQTSKVYPLPREMITVIPNGVDLEMYGEIPPSDKWAHDKDVLHLLYQSRPERGLEHLVRPGGIMDRLRDQPVHLHVCAYDYTSTEMLEFYQRLEGWASLLPNVSLLGALSKPDLVAVQKAMDLLVYPTEFEEVSCITAMEAMAAGLPFLSSAHAALPETCNGSGATLLALKDGKVDEDAFVEAIKARSADRGLLELEEQMQLSAAQHKGWGHVAQELEALMVGLLSKNAGNPVALVRSAIDLSDIDVAIEMQEACEATVPDWPMVRSAGDEIRELFAFRESDEAYAAHYAKHQGIYYDGPGADAVGEDVTGTIRFRGATLAASDIIKETGGVGLKILDYGCAHGHYLMQWAKVLHKSEFVG
jgi:glycosyltransferase involved in cell wall biosynthesis